jgi:hypothetical protein
VTVRVPYGAGGREGGGLPRNAASPAATRKSSNRRPCCRQVATTVSSRSANRLPASLSDPKLPLRHSTAGRRARSAPLLVGSTPSARAKVHSAGHHFLNCRHSAAAFLSGLSCPRRSSRPSRAWSGTSQRSNSGRANSPARKRSGSQGALRPPSPLSTVRDGFSSYGSSPGHLNEGLQMALDLLPFPACGGSVNPLLQPPYRLLLRGPVAPGPPGWVRRIGPFSEQSHRLTSPMLRALPGISAPPSQPGFCGIMGVTPVPGEPVDLNWYRF